MSTDRLQAELLVTAARLVVDEGLEYGPAKQRARKLIAQQGGIDATRLPLPDNDALEAEVFAHIELFCADTQAGELAQLREVALVWMRRLAAFRPHLSGAVWRGTATRLNDIHLELYCDDPKAAELALIDAGVRYEAASRPGPRGGQPVDVLGFSLPHAGLGQHVGVQLTILDHDDLRGALRADATGRTQRGDAAALQRLMESHDER
ncbi:MAG TPA: hypothetical protein VFR90_02310 [Methylibium sp.]|uniref:hypothetical protein n=1 Tax=Methylibium sp. TaxID=2067992 RepID=UPI002DBD40D3|nr:hypothetical protein [Methylibium sp.]HEU4457935.1 hypothetical protein [Methylibium sp.]